MTGHDEPPAEAHDEEPTHRRAVGLVLVAGLAAVLLAAMLDLPRETAALPRIARYALDVALPEWHTTEPVSEVVYGTRGFDTFGETFLLLAAVVSVIVLTRRREQRRGFIGEESAARAEKAEAGAAPAPSGTQVQVRAAEDEEGEQAGGVRVGGAEVDADRPRTPDDVPVGTPAPELAEGMTVVVRVAARIAGPVLAVAGCYLVAWGYTPGGGFPAGAVVAGVILLLYAAFGYRRIARAVRPGLFEALELGGALAIVLTELLGLLLKGSFSANWVHLSPEQTIRSGGVLQLFNVSEFVEVGTGVTLAIFAVMGMRHEWSEDRPAAGDER